MSVTKILSDKAVSNYNMAGLFLIISGILHLPIPFFADFSGRHGRRLDLARLGSSQAK